MGHLCPKNVTLFHHISTYTNSFTLSNDRQEHYHALNLLTASNSINIFLFSGIVMMGKILWARLMIALWSKMADCQP